MTEMDIVVDNGAGGDPDFATDVARLLRARGLEVEVREPGPTAMFDTGVHLLTPGIAIRVPTRPDRSMLIAVEQDVRTALMHRPSVRRRTRSVPVHLGESFRVLEWIDVFD